MPACATIGNSTELYVQNPLKIAATFCETNFCQTFFITSGCCIWVSSLEMSS